MQSRSRTLQCADGDEAETFAAGWCEDLWEGEDGLRWVGDGVVEDEEGAGERF